MKLRFQKQRNRALTLPEVLVVVVVLVFVAAMLMPSFNTRHNTRRIYCVSNLKQINLSFRIWEDDNNNKYPMAIPAIDGGAMESMATGDLVNCFIVMSNELSTPKILVCPEDWGRTAATNFGDGFNASHISYFVNVDVTNEDFPQRVMSGDDNFLINDVPIKSGLVQIPTNASIAWDSHRHDNAARIPYLRIPLRHDYCGNLGFADGSVEALNTFGLQQMFIQSGLATNRLAIP